MKAEIEEIINSLTNWDISKSEAIEKLTTLIEVSEVPVSINKEEPKGLKANTGKFTEGDTVKVIKMCDSLESDWDNVWGPAMNESIGCDFEVEGDYGKSGYQLSNGFAYPEFVLELVKRG